MSSTVTAGMARVPVRLREVVARATISAATGDVNTARPYAAFDACPDADTRASSEAPHRGIGA